MPDGGSGPDEPGRGGSALHFDQHLFCRHPDGGRVRVGGSAPPAPVRGAEVTAVDGLHFAEHGAFGRRIGQYPADPRVPAAAVEEQPVGSVHGGVGRGGQDDLQSAAFPDDGQDLLVLVPDPDRGDHAPGEVHGKRGGAGAQQSGGGAAGDDAGHRPFGAWGHPTFVVALSRGHGEGRVRVCGRAEPRGRCHETILTAAGRPDIFGARCRRPCRGENGLLTGPDQIRAGTVLRD